MDFKNKYLSESDYQEEFTGTEIDYLKEHRIKSETIYCLEQIKKRLLVSSTKERTDYSFIIHEVDGKLFKAIEFIGDRLKIDGFKLVFHDRQHHIDEFPATSSVKFKIVDKLDNKYTFHDRLNKIINFYKSQVLETQRKMTIKEIALIDIGELIKKITYPLMDESQYVTR